MTQPRVTRPRSAAARLAGIGLLAVGVAAAIYLAGRLLTPDYAFGLFGQAGLGAVMLKSLLATIAFGAAIVQVLLALWMYRRLPFAGRPPHPVPLAHRIIGFALFAFTVPIALHCLIALPGGLFLLRRVRREGAAGPEQAAARLGAASRRGHARRAGRRPVVHLRAVVLQRLPASGDIGRYGVSSPALARDVTLWLTSTSPPPGSKVPTLVPRGCRRCWISSPRRVL